VSVHINAKNTHSWVAHKQPGPWFFCYVSARIYIVRAHTHTVGAHINSLDHAIIACVSGHTHKKTNAQLGLQKI
jgi:hypothetical protein